MPVRQVNFYVDDHTAAKLASGAWTAFGSVVRDGSRIVAHLKEVPTSSREPEAVARRVLNALATRKGLLIVAAAVAVVAVVVIGIVALRRRLRRQKEIGVEKRVTLASVAYLDAIRAQTMGPVFVDNLLTALGDADARLRASETGAQATPEKELVEFAGVVRDYTARLAAENGVRVLTAAEESREDITSGDVIAAMRRDLTVQRELWAAA